MIGLLISFSTFEDFGHRGLIASSVLVGPADVSPLGGPIAVRTISASRRPQPFAQPIDTDGLRVEHSRAYASPTAEG